MPISSPYQNNQSTPAPTSTVGLKVSKPGYDATRTSGSNYIFDSSWPSLPIAFETTVTSAFPASVAHNLKFPPFAMVWATGADPSGLGTMSRRFIFPVDSTNLYLDTSSFGTPLLNFWNSATTAKIRCFQLDLSQDIDYVLAPGDTFNMPYDSNFGIKVAKPNKDVNSKDLRDFAIHSRAQSPLILAVKTQATQTNGASDVVQYTSNLSYAVWVYGFIRTSANKYKPAPYYSQAYPKTTTDGFVSYIQYTAPDTGATLVILRDPMFASTKTTVQY